MSVIQDMFKYNKSFDGILKDPCSKKFNNSEWGSVYGENRAVSCSISVYKGVKAYAQLTEMNSGKYAIGRTHNGSRIAERRYTDQIGSVVTTDICAITSKGTVQAGMVRKEPFMINRYEVGTQARGGTVLFLALMSDILADDEALEEYQYIKKGLLLNPESETKESFEAIAGMDLEIWAGHMAKFSDNVYQRMTKGLGPVSIKLTISSANGETRPITEKNLTSGTLMPESDIIGEFKVFMKPTMDMAETNVIKVSDFTGRYAIKKTRLSKEEKALVPVFDNSWVVPKEAMKICNLIKETSEELEPMRNFMLVGESGSGKTKAAEFIALGLKKPMVKITCSADMEIFDFIGQNMPINEENEEYNDLPSIDDISFDLKDSYYKLTGEDELPPGFDEGECIELLIEKIKKGRGKENSSGFKYVETPFIKALKNGWVVEVQEPTVITRPGVLVGLNSLLEQNGITTLPTGETIKRHSDAVVIVTTNRDYRGCDDMNQSVISRMDQVISMNLPDSETLVNRVRKRSGLKDTVILRAMVDVVERISIHLRHNDINDGTCGVRELISWAKSVKVEGADSAYENARGCIIEKATMDPEIQVELITGILDTSIFAIK